MADKPTLNIQYASDPKHSDDPLPKRVYATINAAVFIHNELDRRFIDLESMFLEYCLSQANKEEALKPGQLKTDWGYPPSNHMVSLAWDMVDWSERLRKALCVTAGIKKKNKWYTAQIDALAPIKEIRHFIQHYDKEFHNFVLDSYPLMGALYACFPTGASYTTFILPSTPLKSAYHSELNIYGLELPKRITGKIDCITFSIARHSVNLSELMRTLRASKAAMREHLSRKYSYIWPEH